MEKEKVVKASTLLSLILRHKPETVGIKIDENGWAICADLLIKLEENNFPLTEEELEFIVKKNNKKRFAFSDDGLKIRANQGHSIDVDVQFKVKRPPTKLFHGTAVQNIESIREKGILKGDRNNVHLSTDYKTAVSVGIRYGKPKVLKINSKKMHDDGVKFYLSKNGIWLVDYVDTKYIFNLGKPKPE